MASNGRKKPALPRLRIIPLGGVGEIGKNMTVFEYGDDIVVVDVGSMFPGEEMPGVDLVIPDTTYLQKNASRIRAYLITHGHEDHIGGTPYIVKQYPAPVYGTRLTLALIEHKFKEHKINDIQLNVIKPGDRIHVGNSFDVEFIKVGHSIAGAVAMAITTPVGTVVHTGDFKVDFTPIDEQVIDLGRFAQLGKEGVIALLADSTNVERPGYTMSERHVGETFMNLFDKAEGRIIVAMFSSNVHRVQQVVDAAVRYNRKVCLIGRSMINVSKVAMQLGELRIPEGRLLTPDEIDRYDDNEIVVMTTGSQGESMSGLSRMALGEHAKLEIKASDMVIISATPIPGNEKSVSRVINLLMKTGANVIYESLAEVHVSGHACREELKLIHTLTKPKYFIPVHGEARHLHHHARLAKSLGMSDECVHIPDQGEIIEISKNKMSVAGTVPNGIVLVDGLGVGDVGTVVLRDRMHLSQDGLLIAVICIDKKSGMVVSGPDIVSRGLVYVRESDDLAEGARIAARNALSNFGRINPGDWNQVKNAVRDSVQRFVYGHIKRSPMVLPIIMEVDH
ncbi:ribonuclease J [Eubacteriales bacterium OttesenSCG-928-N13]|nr:ribonuclease J [Eubacteriales bacterium OttesenSCG-928-N13]